MTGSKLIERLARKEDIEKIIEMLADDPLGATREKVTPIVGEKYIQAFERIQQNPFAELTVVELAGEIIGTFHLNFLQFLTYEGGLRAQIEAVRVATPYRGKGIGTAMFHYAIARAKEKGCHMLQLTTNKKRPGALKFYESLGFVDSHIGLKLLLDKH
ncbi:GNAT family N-acetyltransferase [Chitinophaga skermanii]|nr:GNAT family N-acetyltransferase [Chitinophaga skermanii]